jgi:hypothetical protein
MMRPPNGYNGAGEFVIPSRERVTIGEHVTVEASFGALADEILIEGVVTDIQASSDGLAPTVTIHIFEPHIIRMGYILEVLGGHREATARRYRRVPADMGVRWWWGIKAHAQRAQGISFGGTFIQSVQTPRVGFRTEVEIRTDAKVAPIRIPSTVVWSGDPGTGQHGFGVRFQVDDTRTADRLRALVKQYERTALKEVVTLSHN